VRECFGGHVHIGGKTQERADFDFEKFNFGRRDEFPEIVLPGLVNLAPDFADRKRVLGDAI